MKKDKAAHKKLRPMWTQDHACFEVAEQQPPE